MTLSRPFSNVKTLLLIAAAMAPAVSFGCGEQEFPPYVYPSVVPGGKTAADFVPKGWKVLGTAEGDLNHDGKPDLAIVLQGTDKAYQWKNEGLGEPEVDQNPRMLVIALANPAGGFRKLTQNNNFIPVHDNPMADDPFDSIDIQRGLLNVQFRMGMSAGSWSMSTTQYKFRYEDAAMRLIGYEYYHRHRASGAEDIVSTNLLTGMQRAIRSDGESQKPKETWQKLKIGKKWTLDTLRSGPTFDETPVPSNP
jgi:hypothetical protein